MKLSRQRLALFVALLLMCLALSAALRKGLRPLLQWTCTVTIFDDLISTNQIVYDGNSLTTSGNYPSDTTALLTGTWATSNTAVGGQATPAMIARGPTIVDPIYSRAMTKRVVIAWEGTNDLYYGASATTTYNNLVTYCQDRRARGWKVIIVTILPRSNSGTPGTFEVDRQTVNANIRANWATFADGLADVAADSRIGDAGDETDTTYYVDLVHMTTAGYNIVAGIVAAAVNAL